MRSFGADPFTALTRFARKIIRVEFWHGAFQLPQRGCGTKPKVGPLMALRAYLGSKVRNDFNLEEVVAHTEVELANCHNLFEVENFVG